MHEESCPACDISIFIAGDVDQAKQICREYCLATGFCVTVTPTNYIYTGGEEAGVRVGIINYPRFPVDSARLLARALALGDMLRRRLCQQSYCVSTPERTIWRSWRGV